MKIPKKDEEKKEKVNVIEEDFLPEESTDTEDEGKDESMSPKERYERLRKTTGQVGEDQPLFGEDDLIVNTLELEKRELNEEIGKARKAIISKQIEIKDKESRVDNIQKSIEIIRDKHFPGSEKEDPKKESDVEESSDDVKEPEPGETVGGSDS